jgi:VanZ family protein
MPRSHGTKFVPWLLVGVVALIAYGSLYPFNFKPDAIEGGLLKALGQLSWARAGRGDRISNVLLYFPLGFCLFLWLNARLRRVPAIVLGTLLGALLSLAIEVAQVYVSIRVPSLTDLSLNTLGTAVGAIGGLAWRIGTLWMHLPSRIEKPVRDPTAAIVIVLWVSWRFAPFVPHLDLGKLKAALRPLFDPQLDASLAFAFLTCWVVVTQALAALVSRARLLEALLVLIAVVLVGRLLVAEQVFVPSELIALVLLLPVVVAIDRLTPGPRNALLLVSILIVLVSFRLAPFEFAATATAFDFWPFLVWFNAGIVATVQATDWPFLFGQAFLFGAFLWAIKRCGTSVWFAGGVLLAFVVVTEIVQLWLPGHTGSLTDIVIAAAVASAFRYVDRRSRRIPGVARANPRFGRSQ